MAARYSRISAFPQIILLLFLVAILSVGGLLWFDFLGLLDVTDTLAPLLRLVGVEQRSGLDEVDDIMLMDRLRLEKLQEAVSLREVQLEETAGLLDEQRLAFLQREQELAQLAAELEERENSLNEQLQQYENRRAVLEQNSRDLTSMRPDDAVGILSGYDDQLLIDTLRVTEELAQAAGEVSLVSVWLSRLPAERAAEIQRKMTLTPAD
ncbi:MAG: flagellar protein FlbB [Spirochaetales bacterium]|nr:flagellar protein FlbB [Spirochaetales bacterium]